MDFPTQEQGESLTFRFTLESEVGEATNGTITCLDLVWLCWEGERILGPLITIVDGRRIIIFLGGRHVAQCRIAQSRERSYSCKEKVGT